MAFDAVSSGGVGWIMEKGNTSQAAYFVGFEAPIVSKTEIGYVLKNQTTYLYCDFNGTEMQAIRTYAINQKSLYTDKNVQIYLGMGGGFWSFTNTDGSDNVLGAFNFNFGATWHFLDFTTSIDIVPQDGADIFMPSIGMSIVF